jgi:methionine biosynthesis protein MetW
MNQTHTLSVIADLVPQGSRVLDLGCGGGSFLAMLQQERGCRGYGIELNDDKVLECVQKGVSVMQRNLEEGLSLFDDDSFDVVLQIDTLQNIRNTEQMLKETVRVGRMGIISFPNFAHWPNRISVLKGAMPVTKVLPYQWFNTPNIRVGTYRDFGHLARACGLDVVESFGLHHGKLVSPFWANLLGSTAVFKVVRSHKASQP